MRTGLRSVASRAWIARVALLALLAPGPALAADDKEPGMPLAGRTFLYRYESGLEVTGRFESATTLTWEALTGPARGTKGSERIHALEVAPDVFFVSWLEASGTSVSQVLDLGRGRVTAFVTYEAGEGRRGSSFDTGTIVER